MRRLTVLLAFNVAVLIAAGIVLLRAHALLAQVQMAMPQVRALPGLPGLYVEMACIIARFDDDHVYVDCPGRAELKLHVVEDGDNDQGRS